MTKIAASKKSDRCDADAIARMTGLKSANNRMRQSTRPLNSSQLALYLAISCFSVANAFTTCTPAMFSVMMETFLSSASIAALAAGWTILLNRRMYQVQIGSGMSDSSAIQGFRVAISVM